MNKKPKKGNKPVPPTGEHLIPPALPIEALSAYTFDHDEQGANQIASYVESQARDETVAHAEHVMTEHLLGRKHQCWDVRTDKSRYWVITGPTNLYDQKLFPSLDYTLSFHIGLMARFMAKHEPQTGFLEQITMPAAWRKWEQAGAALDKAEEPEDFQTVGMRCRESLIAMVHALAHPTTVPQDEKLPQKSNVLEWCALIANHVAHGSSAEYVRGYLKSTSKASWQLVNWLTHSHGAHRADAIMAHEVTHHVLTIFATAALRHRQGVPDRCDKCGSYKFELWADEPGVPLRPRCVSCGWMKDDEL